jgi:hypothetical protein
MGTFGASLLAATLAAGTVAVGAAGGLGVAGASGGALPKIHMLALSDFPRGWTKTGTKVTTTTAQTLIATLAPCLGVTAASEAGIPSRTRTFSKTNGKTPGLTVFEGVAQFPSTSSAAATWAVLSNTKMPVCTAASFTKHLTQTATFSKTGLTVSPPTSTSLKMTPYGAGTVSFRFHYTVKGRNNFSFTTRFLYVGILRGDYLVQMFVSGLHPSTSLVKKLTAAAQKRVG